MDNKKIGEFIALLRKDKKMTQKDLAEELFVSDKAVSKWERGLSLPDIGLIEKLADILDVNVSEVLKGEKLSKITKKNTDSLVKESIPFFQKQYFKNKISKISFIIAITLFAGYILLMVIGEINHGELQWNIWGTGYSLNLPSFSAQSAKRKTTNFIRNIHNYDFDNVAIDSDLILTNNPRDGENDYNDTLIRFIKSGYKIVKYEFDGCYYRNWNYECSYYLRLENNDDGASVNISLGIHDKWVWVTDFGYNHTYFYR